MVSEVPAISSADAAPGAPEAEESDIDVVPDPVLDAARRAFATRDRDATLLSLVADSALEPGGSATSRRLLFSGAEGDPDLMVELDSATRVLDLRCSALAGADVTVETGAGPAVPTASGDGRWRASLGAPGLISVVLLSGGRRFRTSWTRV